MKVDLCLQITYARRIACTRKRRDALVPRGNYAERGFSHDKHVCSPNLSVTDIASCRKLNCAPVREARPITHHTPLRRWQRTMVSFFTVPPRASLVMPIHLFSRLDAG